MFKVGDTIRFTKTGFTAKIIKIGTDPDASDPYEERYFVKVSADDAELIVGEGNELTNMSFPVAKANGYIEKI